MGNRGQRFITRSRRQSNASWRSLFRSETRGARLGGNGGGNGRSGGSGSSGH